MNRNVVCGAFLFAVPIVATTSHALTSPRDGSPRPPAVIASIEKDPGAYRNRRAWAEKARAARDAREAALLRTGRAPVSTPLPANMALAGTLNVPVLPAYFNNQSQPGSPITQALLQAQLFDSNPTGSVSDYYSEVSYGQFTIDGTVYPWVELAQNNDYYAANSQGLVPGDARTGFLIKELLDANDPTIDFGEYDNDGPDGESNSGDDDGYVDVLCIVHSLRGGECALAANIASHAWSYSAWDPSGGAAYTTNDARFGGGFIQVDDYNITPALSCDVTPAAIEVGALCHELGHALGLPDLHDRNLLGDGGADGNQGIGDWGLMGTGNWNDPASPAHFDAWCKKEMGWLVPTVIGWQSTVVGIPAVEQNATAYMLPFTDERFRRSTSCAISGAYSFYCGLPEAEGTARGWIAAADGGYGANWYQTVEHDFTYNGSGSVTFHFACTYNLELNYDFARAIIEVNGVETVLLDHTGIGGGTANVNLTTALAPLAGAGGTYTLKFRVVSDYSFDDADGENATDCGAFVFDDVSVAGGGVNYVTNFETNGGGWHQDPAENPVSEYWLVENRRRVGFDQGLHEEGLLIWHVDEEVLHAKWQVNDAPGGAVRGLVLEEADGQFDLNDGFSSNTGEPQDVFPGPLNQTAFDSGTSPDSDDNTGRTTQVSVTAVGPAGPSTSATLRAGDPAPAADSVTPNNIDNDLVAVVVDVAGSNIRYGATFHLAISGGAATQSAIDGEDIVATSLEWVDATRLRGTLNVYSKTAGAWDLVVTNPDGQTVTLPGAVSLNHIVATQLLSAAIDVVGDGVRLRYELLGREAGEVLRLYRSTRADGGWAEIVDDLPSVHGDFYEYLDTSVEAGVTYFYLLESALENGEVRELHRGFAVVPARELVLEQNHPNPFNPRTSIRFYLPERGPIELNVYDVHGALVRRLALGDFDSGVHAVEWDGTDARGEDVASGVYVYRLVSDRRRVAKKMVLLK